MSPIPSLEAMGREPLAVNRRYRQPSSVTSHRACPSRHGETWGNHFVPTMMHTVFRRGVPARSGKNPSPLPIVIVSSVFGLRDRFRRRFHCAFKGTIHSPRVSNQLICRAPASMWLSRATPISTAASGRTSRKACRFSTDAMVAEPTAYARRGSRRRRLFLASPGRSVSPAPTSLSMVR